MTLAATPRVARACELATDPHGVVPEYALSDQAEEIDLAFIGRQVSQETYGTTGLKVIWNVDHVYKGNAASLVEIHAETVYSNCCPYIPHRIRSPEPVPVLAKELAPGIYSETGCFGFILPVPSAVDLKAEFGAGYAPDNLDGEAGPDGEASPDGDSLPVEILATILTISVVALLAVGSFAARRRRRRAAAQGESPKDRL